MYDSLMVAFIDNICSVYRRATDAHIEAGTAWYQEAHNLALALTPHDVTIGAGVIAVLSPKTLWERNQELAIRAFHDGISTGGLGPNCAKANRIMAGEPAELVIGGPKVTSFYRTIVDPNGDHDAVIDRHAYDIAMGKRMPEKDRKINRTTYREMVAAYAQAAFAFDTTPTILQAATWVAWREGA
jgi:hypothetical protein